MKLIPITIAILCLSFFSIKGFPLSAFAEPTGDLLKRQEEVRKNPRLSEARFNLGLVYASLGHFEEAISELKEAIRIKPDNAWTHFNLGLVYASLGRFEEAILELKKAISLKPDDAWAHFNLGLAYVKLSRDQEAIPELKETIRLKPGIALAHLNLGLAYVNLGSFDEAIPELREAIRLNPDDALAYLSLGLAYANLSRYQEAIPELKETIRLKPGIALAHLNLGLAYVNLGSFDEAIPELREAIRLNPDDALAHLHLGLAYANISRYEEAVSELREATRLMPDSYTIRSKLGMMYVELGHWEDAINELNEVVRLDSMKSFSSDYLVYKSNAHLKLGEVHYQLGHWEKAVAEYSEATRLNPAMAVAYFNMGKANSRLGRWTETLIAYSTAFGLDANFTHYNMDRSQTFLISGALFLFLLLSALLLIKVSLGSAIKQKVNSNSFVYRPDIDGLRAVAVLSVVAFHARWRGVPGGFIGVDVFFVISGYLISGILFKNLESGSFSFFDFYSRRIKRIFPALVAVLLAVWGAGWFVLLGDEYKSLGKHTFFSAAFLQNFTLWLEAGYFDSASDFKPLLHLWSLGVEEQYYIIWPLLLYVGWKRKINALLLLCSVALASFALNAGQIGKHAIATFYLPHTRFWELMLGGALAYGEVCKCNPDTAQLNRFTRNIKIGDTFKNIEACLGFSLVVGAVLFLDKSKAYPGWWALIPIAGACLLISAGKEAWVNRNILANPLMVFIGLISYPLYLWHWPLLALVRIGLNHPPHVLEIAAIALSFILSWLTYEYLEKPVRFGKFSKATKTVSAALIIFIAGAGLIGAETYRAEGFISRFPEAVQYLANYPVYSEKARNEKCLQDPPGNRDMAGYESDCIDPEGNISKPLVLLWGDSVAAHLYPGFKHLQSIQNFRLAQFTAGSCPPLLLRSQISSGKNISESCHQFNDYVAKEIIKLKPKTVILSGFWTLYGDMGAFDAQDETVVFLKKSGVAKIILIGPTPTWNPTLPKALFSFFKNDPIHRLPDRMWHGLDLNVRTVDEYMHKKADRLGIIYISPFNMFCRTEGCLTRVGNNPEDLVIYDNVHFTPSGSRFFIGNAFAKLLLS